jgi:hypothetical protein
MLDLPHVTMNSGLKDEIHSAVRAPRHPVAHVYLRDR